MPPAQKNPPPENPNTQRALPPIKVPRATTDVPKYVAEEMLRQLGLQNQTDIAAFSLFVNSPDNYYEYLDTVKRGRIRT